MLDSPGSATLVGTLIPVGSEGWCPPRAAVMKDASGPRAKEVLERKAAEHKHHSFLSIRKKSSGP